MNLFNYGGETPDQISARRRFEEDHYELVVKSIMEARTASAQAAAAAAGGGSGKVVKVGQFSAVQLVIQDVDNYQYIIIDAEAQTTTGLIDSGIPTSAEIENFYSTRLKGFEAIYYLDGKYITQFIDTAGRIIRKFSTDDYSNWWLDGKDDSGRLFSAQYNEDPNVLYYFDGQEVLEVTRQTTSADYSINWWWDRETANSSVIVTLTDNMGVWTFCIAKQSKLIPFYTVDSNSDKYAFPIQYNYGEFIIIVEELNEFYTGLKIFNQEGVLIKDVDLVSQYGNSIWHMQANFYGTDKVMMEFISDADGDFGNNFILLNYDHTTGNLVTKAINRDLYPESSSWNLDFWFGNPYYHGEGRKGFSESAISFYWNSESISNPYCFDIAGSDIKAVYIFPGEEDFTEYDLVNSQIYSITNVTGIGSGPGFGPITNIEPDVTNSENGNGATFNISTDGDGNYQVEISNEGTGYRPGDSFVILGSKLFGGSDTVNTLIFTVDEIWDAACAPSSTATGVDVIYVPANHPDYYGNLSTVALYRGGEYNYNDTGIDLYDIDYLGNWYNSDESNYQKFGDYLSYMIQGGDRSDRRYLVIDSQLNTVGFLEDNVYGRNSGNAQRVAYNTLLVREWGGLGRSWVWTPNTEGFYQFASADDDSTFFIYRTYQIDDNPVLSDKMLILDRGSRKFRLITELGISNDVYFTENDSGNVIGVGLGSNLILAAYYNADGFVTVKTYSFDLTLINTTTTSGDVFGSFIYSGDQSVLTVHNSETGKFSILSFFGEKVIEFEESLNITSIQNIQLNTSNWGFID